MMFSFYQLRPKSHPFPILAWLIMIFQGMNPFSGRAFSHTAIAYWVDDERIFFDVTGSGCRTMDEKDFLIKYRVIKSRCKYIQTTEVEFLDWFHSKKDCKYDRLQVFGLLLKALRLKKKNTWGGNFNSLICNELLLAFLVDFDELKIGDSDDWDLNMTWEAIVETSTKVS